MPSIGRFRHNVMIQRRKIEKGPTGPTETWVTQETRKAAISVVGLAKRTDYMQLGSEVTHTFQFIGNVDIEFRDTRLIWNDRIYEPVSPDHDRTLVGRFTGIVAKDVGPYVEES